MTVKDVIDKTTMIKGYINWLESHSMGDGKEQCLAELLEEYVDILLSLKVAKI